MFDSLEKDLEEYLSENPELSDFGYSEAYQNGDIKGMVAGLQGMREYDSVLEEKLSLLEDERGYTSILKGLGKAVAFTAAGLALVASYNWVAPPVREFIDEQEAKFNNEPPVITNYTVRAEHYDFEGYYAGRGTEYSDVWIEAEIYDKDGSVEDVEFIIQTDNLGFNKVEGDLYGEFLRNTSDGKKVFFYEHGFTTENLDSYKDYEVKIIAKDNEGKESKVKIKLESNVADISQRQTVADYAVCCGMLIVVGLAAVSYDRW